MTDYRTLRKEERKSAMYHLSICMLAILDDNVLDIMNLTPALRGAINTIRAEEDDYVGAAAAFFAFQMSNYDMTDQDRLVASQALAVGSGAIQNRRVATKSMFDSEDILVNRTIMENIATWISEAEAPNVLVGDAVFEQGVELLKYIEQYDRRVKDKSQVWTKGGENESETASESNILDWIPFVGKQ